MAEQWWREGVLYQIYPRSFADGNGDGIGDLSGLTSKLEYLEWLGIDGIWLNPIHPSPNVDWGYDVADYTDVHPDLGSLADLDRLIASGRRRGIRVLLDLVPNHTSHRHPWFRERPEFYVWSDHIPNNWRPASVAVPHGRSTRSVDATTCTTSPPSSPTSTGGTRVCVRSSSGSSASGSTEASPASGSTCAHALDQGSRASGRSACDRSGRPETRKQGCGVSFQ